jgi:hypothetical protein
VDSFRRPVFERFVLWIRFVKTKIPNYSIHFVLEGFVYESLIKTFSSDQKSSKKQNFLFKDFPSSDQGLIITLGVSICLDRVSIETLDLDTKKQSVSTVEKISTVSKS